MISPSAALVLALLGVLGIYSEFIWPARIMPGVLGTAALAWGCYLLWCHQPSRAGVALIGIAIAFLITESLYKTYFVAGALATACLALGACKLFNQEPHIETSVAIPASAIFGGITMFLGSAAKRARRNKRSDL